MTEAIMCFGRIRDRTGQALTPFLLKPFGRGAAVAVPVGNPHSRGAVCAHLLNGKKQERGC